MLEAIAASGYHGDNGGFGAIIIGIISIAAVWFGITVVVRAAGNAARRVVPRKYDDQ